MKDLYAPNCWPGLLADHPDWFNLADHQRMACVRINAARDQAANAGFAWNGHQFDSDAGSIQKINGAATLALLNPAFETDWILADNTIIHLTNADIRSLGEAAGAFVQGLVFKARTLKDQALATTTIADCTAVHWT